MSASHEVNVNTATLSGDERANILIVDDRTDKLLVFKTILEDLGQNIITLQSGEEALRWLLDNECAVMLLDVNMPGMDGFETAQLVRGRRRSAHLPIIFITAYVDEMHTAKGYSLGAVDYLLSPAVPNVLRSKVTVFVQLYNLTQQIKRQADEHVHLAHEQAARAAAEESTRRASFLAEASKILISSLDVNSLMVGATRLVVPMLADFSAIVLIDGEGILVRTASGAEWNLHEMRNTIIQDPQWLAGIDGVLASGQAAMIDNLWTKPGDAPPAERAEEEEKMSSGRFRIGHVAMLPLLARDKTYGVLALTLGPSGRRFDSADLELATDFAARVAIALDNCLLFKEVQEGDRRKNEFLATLSHELRNPLAPMRTAIHTLHLSEQWPPGAEKLREMLERQLRHLTHLVDDLLDVARISQGKIQLRKRPTDLVAEIRDALETCKATLEGSGHHIAISLPAGEVMVEADHVRMQQIFENLLFNAGKYTDPGGRIQLILECDQHEAVVRIRDSGVGIAPEMMSRIWEMFAQVDDSSDRIRQGLGIGLALAKKLVHLHGGEIQALSEGLGKGSEFVVRLPLLDAVAQADGHSAQPGQNTRDMDRRTEMETETGTETNAATRRILVVDDNADAAESLAMLLGVFGHTVEIAYEGHAAMRAARAFKPELVFLDIGLPGMNGYEVARCMRDEAGMTGTKLIALSGYGTESDRMQSKEAGFDRHLVKPIDPRAVPDIISSAFKGNP